MGNEYTGEERRQFLRYDYTKPLRYCTLYMTKGKSFVSEMINAISGNLSASGILFIANIKKVPAISSVLILELDCKTAVICEEIEKRVLMLGNKLLGRVVRIEDYEDGTCGVGVAFVTKSDPLSSHMDTIEDLISSVGE